jgi:predicted outer membrane repeat protein
MAKLIFESAEILNSGGSSQGVISNITVEGVEVTLEPDTVNVEDNREIYESYTGRIVIRSKNTAFDGGGAILSSAFVSTDGTLPTEGKLKLNGKSGSHDLTTELTYIQGHNAFDNGRLETVLVAQASDVDGEVAMVVASA